VAGLAIALGSGAMTNPIADVLKSETILVTGSNTTENHPIFANYIKEAVFRKGANLIVADPRRIDLVDDAHIWLRQKPGTDIAWINGLIHIILKENLHAADYIRERTEGFAELEKAVEKYTPQHVSEITGIPVPDLRKAAFMYGKARPASILYTMGITQHTNGTDTVLALANLAMVCGNIGVEGGGINPLRGQNNVQGACDMGALPNVLPAYQQVTNSESREKFSRAWGVALSDKPGLTVVEISHAAEAGRVKGIYIVGENPLLSDPDLTHVKAAFEKLDFLVVQDIFMTETARAADVVLPSACFAEKDGTFTNSERLVQRVRKAIRAPGEARADWEIVSDLSTRLGYPMNYHNPREIMEEISSLAPSYAGITYARIEKEEIAWPCPTHDHPGTKMLHKDKFVRGKGLFNAIEYTAPAEIPDDEYPLILTTGRVIYHYHTGSMTRIGRGINERCPESLIEINPADARELGIDSGMMVDVSSRRGKLRVKAKVTDRPPAGTVFMNFHFREAAVNLLTNPALDPVSKIPELKACAVKVEAA
jgi:formate dehydrogenase alpha subunit